MKLPNDRRSQPLRDVNDNATDKLVKSYINITMFYIYSSAMIIHSKMSLHAFGNGSTGYSRIWRKIYK